MLEMNNAREKGIRKIFNLVFDIEKQTKCGINSDSASEQDYGWTT